MIRRRYLRNRARGNIVYPGLIAAWSAKGKSNDDKDKRTLKDLTGNGHDITLNGFAFSEMSGYSGYKTNMLNWKYYKNSAVILSSQNKFIIYNTLEIVTHFWDYVTKPPLGTIHRPSFKLKISGLNEDEGIYYIYRDGEDFSVPHKGNLYNGINIFPEINAEIVTENLPYTTVFDIQNQNILDKEITFEILPEYPDALVFDGVNDYGFCTNIPLLEDYTIIAKRKDCSNGCLFTKGADSNGAFVLEGYEFTSNTYNYGQGQNKNLLLNNTITWQNKNSYNQQNLIVGDKSDNTNRITIGTLNDMDSRYLKGAFYSAYLFDRSLDEQEIKAFIRKYIDPEYLLPSEIPTPDCYYDLSQGSNDDENRETIKDYSGNGNNAVAHNFGWNEEGSGYKDGALYFDGTNDYVSLDAFDSGFKTIFMKFKPINTINSGYYDQIKKGERKYYFSVSDYSSDIAFSYRNTNGKTYINGILNTSILSKDVVNKTVCIGIVNENVTADNTTIPKIGDGTHFTPWFANMALYKFLGFKEALTEKQIQAVIKKYNLLDGVDKIEVS